VTAPDDLAAHLARFAGALRDRGVPIGIGDEIDAMIALTLVDVSDRGEVRLALRAALKVRRRDWAVFDELFDRLWVDAAHRTPSPSRAAAARSTGGIRRRPTARESSETEPHDLPPGSRDGNAPGYSPDVLLRRKPFDECSERDLGEMERLLARWMPSLATRPSRRLVPAPRGWADPRRSFRRAIGTDGDLVSLAFRARAIERPRLVVLCDTSGSMEPHTRFFLAFVLALRRLARSTEVFVFNTSLTRVTMTVASGRIGPMLDRLAAGVPDWSGGTKIGECLTEFVTRYQDRLVTSKTSVLIVSDGLDRGDTRFVAGAVRSIRSKARRVIWLNPLAGDPRYEPTARAMQAALPFIDRLVPAHNLESLERVLPALAG
jgi:hypothetical protein